MTWPPRSRAAQFGNLSSLTMTIYAHAALGEKRRALGKRISPSPEKPRKLATHLTFVGQKSARRALVSSIAYAVTAAFLGLCAAALGSLTYDLSTHGIETSAKVTKSHVGPRHRNIIVEFSDYDGRPVRAELPGAEVGSSDVGDTVRIRYEPDNPSVAMGAGTAGPVFEILLAVPFAVGAIGFAVLAYRRIRDRPRREPEQEDQRIEPDSEDLAPPPVANTGRGGNTNRASKGLVVLSITGAALVAYRLLAGRRPK
jgi:hypothetical protein